MTTIIKTKQRSNSIVVLLKGLKEEYLKYIDSVDDYHGKDSGTYQYGLCDIVNVFMYSKKMNINKDERILLINYILDNKPDEAKDLDGTKSFYWPLSDKWSRLRWLDKHIKLTDENNK